MGYTDADYDVDDYAASTADPAPRRPPTSIAPPSIASRSATKRPASALDETIPGAISPPAIHPTSSLASSAVQPSRPQLTPRIRCVPGSWPRSPSPEPSIPNSNLIFLSGANPDAPGDMENRPSVFTTMRRFFPSLPSIKVPSFLSGLSIIPEWFAKSFGHGQEQKIIPQIVQRSDGSRKKILIDGGLNGDEVPQAQSRPPIVAKDGEKLLLDDKLVAKNAEGLFQFKTPTIEAVSAILSGLVAEQQPIEAEAGPSQERGSVLHEAFDLAHVEIPEEIENLKRQIMSGLWKNHNIRPEDCYPFNEEMSILHSLHGKHGDYKVTKSHENHHHHLRFRDSNWAKGPVEFLKELKEILETGDEEALLKLVGSYSSKPNLRRHDKLREEKRRFIEKHGLPSYMKRPPVKNIPKDSVRSTSAMTSLGRVKIPNLRNALARRGIRGEMIHKRQETQEIDEGVKINELEGAHFSPSNKGKNGGRSVAFDPTAHVKPFETERIAADMPDSSYVEPVKFGENKRSEKSSISEDIALDDSFIELEPSAKAIESLKKVDQKDDEVKPEHVVDQIAKDLEGERLQERELKQEPVVPPKEEAVTPKPKPLIAPLSDKWRTELANLAESNRNLPSTTQLTPQYLTKHDLSTVLPIDFQGSASSWLNDSVVNEYLKIIVEEEKKKHGFVKKGPRGPPAHAFPSQWWIKYSESGVGGLARWSKRADLDGTKLLDANTILIPICSNNHWTLLAISPQTKIIEYLDSLARHKIHPTPYFAAAKAWLKSELKEGFVEEEWTEVVMRSERQLNGSDCGVFACLNALALVRGAEPGEISPDNGMMEARRLIVATLMNNSSEGLVDE